MATNGTGTNGSGANLPLEQLVPRVEPRRDDPAAQPPVDPARDPARVQAQAEIVYREIPNTTVATQWDWSGVRAALLDLVQGQFDRPAQLVEAILGDDRVQATMGSRTGGLLGRPVQFEASRVRRVKGSDAAKECLAAWRECWPTIANEAALGEIHQWGITLAMAPGQLLWDTGGDIAVPHIRPFHPRFTYYLPPWRAYLAVTLDGLVVITPGDGKWICHAPHGIHRGWMRGAVRALAQPWIQRALTYRDMARFCERHGFPIHLFKPPAGADSKQIAKILSLLESIGQESVFSLPQGVEKQLGYELELLEAKDSTWEVFVEAIKLCDAAITLTMLGQNLTTEVKEGSFAAARVHGDVRQAFIEFDARALSATINQQIARPFAAINFGDADLAPSTAWKITPYEDNKAAAETLSALAMAMNFMRLAGHEVTDPAALAAEFDLRLSRGKLRAIDPTQVEVAVERAKGGGGAKTMLRLGARVADPSLTAAEIEASHDEMLEEAQSIVRKRKARNGR